MKRKIFLVALVAFANLAVVSGKTIAATSYCIKSSTGGSAAVWFQGESQPNNPSYSAIDLATWQGMTHAQKTAGGPYYLSPVPAGGCTTLNSYEVATTAATTTTTSTTSTTVAATTSTTSSTVVTTTSTTSTIVATTTSTILGGNGATSVKEAQGFCSVAGFWNSKSELGLYQSLKNVTNHKSGAYSDITGWNCTTNRFKQLIIEDKFGLTTQTSMRFDLYFASNISNCWRVKHIFDSGEGAWSNQVCFEAPAITVPPIVGSGSGQFTLPQQSSSVVTPTFVPFGVTGAQCYDGYRTKNKTLGACGSRGGRDRWLYQSFSEGYNKSYSQTFSSNFGTSSSSCVGICYGVPSKVNGLPRNSYVKGHYRSNGTYVKPYTRSKP